MTVFARQVALRFAAVLRCWRATDRKSSKERWSRRLSLEPMERRELLDGEAAGDPLPAAAPGDELLPDMFAWASESRGYLYGSYIDTSTQPGRKLLRFATAAANIGDGPMELRGGAILPGGNQEVYQRVFKEGGGFTDTLVGEFTYHSAHQHIHFDGYAVYNLRQALVDDGAGGDVGDIVASGGKVSFCLLDVARYDASAPPAAYQTCGQNQGISAGWADVYSATLADQWIDVTDVADGEYWLEVVIDPEDRLREKDETNNVARVRVSLGGGGELGDRFESNDSIAAATDLGEVGDRSEVDLSIHAPANDDYFRLEAAADGTLSVTVSFEHDQGDIDVELLDENENVIDSSTSTDDEERIVRGVAAGEVYYLHVFGYSGAVNPHYDLVVDGPDAVLGGGVAGVVWNDENRDGARDAAEPGLAGRLIYVDGNGNGEFDSVPPTSDQFAAADLPLAIEDHQTIRSTIVVAGVARPIEGVTLQLSLTHTYVGDLRAYLESPAGTRIELFSNVGGSGEDMTGTTLSDTAPESIDQGDAPFAGTFRPAEPLSTFRGEEADGPWTLEIEDDASADTGSLLAWSMTIVGEGYFEPSAVTNDQGEYEIADLPAGEHTIVELLPTDWETTFPSPGAVHSIDVSVGETTNGADFGNFYTPLTPARVVDVHVQRSNDPAAAYSVPSGAAQLEPIALAGLDQIVVIFDRPWDVSAASLALYGVSTAQYATVAEAFTAEPGDGGTLVATWTLAEPLEADKLLAVVRDTTAGQVHLDGEWRNPVGGEGGGAFPSGDGRPGGDFAFRFNVLAGDANRDGAVDAADVVHLAVNGFVDASHASYDVRHDLDGDGVVNVIDAAMARDRFGAALPAGEPGASPPFVASAPAAVVARAAQRPAAISADERDSHSHARRRPIAAARLADEALRVATRWRALRVPPASSLPQR